MNDRVASRRTTRRRTIRLLAAASAVVVLLVTVIATGSAMRGDTPRRADPPDATVSSGNRVRVQVLNATASRGLARRATMHLRDRGFDVVEIGTSSEQLDSTVVLDRTGHPDRARRVAEALGERHARVETRADTSRYLDVTVLIGRSWRAPAEPFYP